MAAAGVAGLALFLAGRDDATTTAPRTGPGERARAEPPCPAGTAGNVVIVHAPGQAGALESLRADDAALVRAGQAVLLCPRGRRGRVQAFAAGRTLTVGDPRDPRLQEFVELWLGRDPGE